MVLGSAKLRQARAVLLAVRQQRFIGDRHGDHLAPFFGMADGEHLTRGVAAASNRK